MDKIVTKAIIECMNALGTPKCYRATKFLDEKRIVRVSAKTYNGKVAAKNQNLECVLTIGRPNYLERDFIKKCKKAGEPFPVKKVQLKFTK